ncbi:rCG52667 [Rattus norvegicus]|uniref:RCG52667 n=1 Tax=Rattus norvegicus TaxID=10116 RepID=A6IR35_RAT|nr:rCG52667 [Rattus norvegicus]
MVVFTGLLSMACSVYFPSRIPHHQPRAGPTHNDLGSPQTVTNRFTTGLPTAQSYRYSPILWKPFLN